MATLPRAIFQPTFSQNIHKLELPPSTQEQWLKKVSMDPVLEA